MNDQCHDCKIRKLCYLEEPEEDWTCDHYEPCEYDEEVATDINVGGKDTISRKAAIEALKNDMASLDHIINGMSANDVRLDAYVLQRNQVSYDIYAIEQLPPAQPEQLGTNLAEVGTDCISRQAAIDALRGYLVGKRCPDDGTLTCRLIENEVINKLPPAHPEPFQPWEVLAVQAVLSQPEIIRCKDCRHRDEFGCCKYWVGLTMGMPTTATDDDDFCSHAERSKT